MYRYTFVLHLFTFHNKGFNKTMAFGFTVYGNQTLRGVIYTKITWYKHLDS